MHDVGDVLGDYKLLVKCGSGAYGSVFLAENELTKQQYALKIIYYGGRNYERELKGVIHYHKVCPRTSLLQIYHVGKGEDFFYYTMDAADNRRKFGEYIPDTLSNRLKESGKLTAAETKKMFSELSENLETLHSFGLFHRDIKPDNILWISGKATLGDIGLVTDTQFTMLAGTPGFIPQEVMSGTREFEAKDDFYALGKVVYCAVTGLPVSQFPEYPDSGTLAESGEVILLYNTLCSGELEPAKSEETLNLSTIISKTLNNPATIKTMISGVQSLFNPEKMVEYTETERKFLEIKDKVFNIVSDAIDESDNLTSAERKIKPQWETRFDSLYKSRDFQSELMDYVMKNLSIVPPFHLINWDTPLGILEYVLHQQLPKCVIEHYGEPFELRPRYRELLDKHL